MIEKEYLNINDGVITIENTNYNLTNGEKRIVDFFNEIDYKQYDQKYPHYLKPKLYGTFKNIESKNINRLTIIRVEFSGHYILDEIKELLEDLQMFNFPYGIKEMQVLIKIEENAEDNTRENFGKIFNDFNYIKNIVYNKDKVHEWIIKDEKVYSILFTIFNKRLK